MLRRSLVFLSFFLLLTLSAGGLRPAQEVAKAAAAQDSPPLVFITIPVENVRLMYRKFLPLKDYLEKALSREIVLKVAQNYQEAIESIGTGQAHIAYLDPSAYCEARHRYRVIPLARAILNGSSSYRSVIVARSDADIERIIEAKGKRLALGNRSSSSSYLIPAVMLKEVGIGLDQFAAVDYLEEEDRIALSVLTHRHDIGGLSEQVARKYVGEGMKILKVSEAIPQYSVCASSALPKEMRETIVRALLAIDRETTPALIAAMKDIDGFAEAEDRDFDVVRVMIRNLTGKNYLTYGKKSIKVAILPLYSAITLFDRFDPLMRYLSKKTGYEFKLVIPRDFEDFHRIIRESVVEFSYSNPYIYTQLADGGYLSAFASTSKTMGGDVFRGIIIAHRDGRVRTLGDLKGKKVMIVSPLSAAGFLAQKLYLLENGIDVSKDLTLIDGKRQEEVILNVYRGKVDAGFVRESALEVLREEIDMEKIRIVAATPYIANWPFAATRKADGTVTDAVRKHLVELRDEQVLTAAQVTGFRDADDRDFDSLRIWIRKHEGS